MQISNLWWLRSVLTKRGREASLDLKFAFCILQFQSIPVLRSEVSRQIRQQHRIVLVRQRSSLVEHVHKELIPLGPARTSILHPIERVAHRADVEKNCLS